MTSETVEDDREHWRLDAYFEDEPTPDLLRLLTALVLAHLPVGRPPLRLAAGARIQADPRSSIALVGGNSLVVVDFADNVRRIREVLRRIEGE